MGELAFILTLVGVLLAAAVWFSIKKEWFWVGMSVGFGLLLGGLELASKIVWDRTLSQSFWILSTENPLHGWIAIGALTLFFGAIVVHLAWKMIKDPEYWKRKKK